MARPNLSYLKNLILVVVGFPCGLLTGLTGITNSFLVVPLLAWLVGIKDARLIGSALAVTSFSALTGILAYTQRQSIDLGLTLAVAAGFLLGAALGQKLSAGKTRVILAGRGIGAVVGIAIAAIMLGDAFGEVRIHPLAAALFASRWWVLPASLLGLATGFFGRLLDLAGLLIVPALYYFGGVHVFAAQGSAIAILLVNSVPAALTYARRGLSEAQSAVWVSFGALFGALFGSQTAALHPIYDPPLLVVYAIVMVVMIAVHLMSTPVKRSAEKA